MAATRQRQSELLVVAYPDLAPDDRAWIEEVRAQHQPLHTTIAAHFTLVFPVASVDRAALVSEIQQHAARFQPIPFVLCCAVPFRDFSGDGTDVFLVPDEGFGAIVRLHDRLYSGLLRSELRLDLPFIPHLTIARFSDSVAAKNLADAINAEPLTIARTLSSVDITRREGTKFRTLVKLSLS